MTSTPDIDVTDSTPVATTGRPSNAFTAFQKALRIGGKTFQRALEVLKSDEQKLAESKAAVAEAVRLSERFERLKTVVSQFEGQRHRAVGSRGLVADRIAELEITLMVETFAEHPQCEFTGLVDLLAMISDCRNFLAWFDSVGLPEHMAKLNTAKKELADFASKHGFEIQ